MGGGGKIVSNGLKARAHLTSSGVKKKRGEAADGN